jgi:putative ABC transport system permease protein
MTRPQLSPLRTAHQATTLALRDLWYDRRTSIVLMLTGAAIIAPLLLLFGLKNGVVWTLRQNLMQQPANLEVVVYGSAQLQRDWFQTTAQRPEVGFLIPQTRNISATIDLVNAKRRLVTAVEMIPTAPGDPLVPTGLPTLTHTNQVLVTATLADKLDLSPDKPLWAVIKRITRGRSEHVKLPLNVIGIVPEDRHARHALFTTLDLLVATEDYRDGVLPNITDLTQLQDYAAQRPEFAGARVYAAKLDAVAPLAERMRADGIEIRTQAEKIATVQAFDQLLSFVFQVIAAIGTLGCILALGGALWVNVDRKRRNLALLRLFGFGRGAVALVPVVQSVVITLSGFVLAWGVYWVGAQFFNRVLGQNLTGGYACRLSPEDSVAAAGITLAVALLAAAAGGLRANRIAPAESLREL